MTQTRRQFVGTGLAVAAAFFRAAAHRVGGRA